MSGHVPAWKKLGLKLRHTSNLSTEQQNPADDAASAGNVDPETVSDHKRKLRTNSASLAKDTTPAKKPRLANGTPITTELDKSATPSALTKSDRKKSVSFAADTKDEDGDTAQNIPLALPISPGSTPPKPRKKEKKPKSERPKYSAAANGQKLHAAVGYLSQFYHHPSSWKFNKNREVWILKRVFSTKDIPTEFNNALSFYIHGLKSTGARERLKAACLDADTTGASVLSAESEDEKELREKFMSGLAKGTIESKNDATEDLEAWIKAQPRADIILMALGESLPLVKPRSSSTRNSAARSLETSLENGSTKARAKKSKARTSRIDIDSDTSSSSDSTSTSGSSSDSDDTSSSGTSSESDNSSE